MGLVEKTHDPMFRAIHIDKTLKGERGRDSVEDIAKFYAAYGVDPVLVPTVLFGRHPGKGPPGGGPVAPPAVGHRTDDIGGVDDKEGK